MRKRKGLGVGSVSLVLIFSVLCLTIFALLTLSTARSDAALAERAAQTAKDYYAADTEGQFVCAKLLKALQSGEKPESVRDTQITYDGNGAYYSVAAGDDRYIAVAVSYDGEILHWKEVSGENWTPDENINVYK